MIKFSYEINGTAAGEQTWKTTGTLEIQNQGQFPELVMKALGESFMALTQGKAEYGKPGVGCNGPYSVTRLVLEATEQRNGNEPNRKT